MMRLAKQSRTRRGLAATGAIPGMVRHCVCAIAALGLALAFVLPSQIRPVLAQSPVPNQVVNPFVPTPINPNTGRPFSAFPQTQGGIFGGPVKKPDNTQPLLLEGDELIYDTRNNRVVARGNVQIYYNDYILTGDQVIYDQNANTLTAEGNVQIKEPNGNVVRGDRLITTDDFRDAFIQSLSAVLKDDTRIAARRAVRRDGGVSEFEQGKFTPCKNDPGQPPLWCISGQRIIHDQQEGSVIYQDAQFEVLGVPVFWAPFFSHADASAKQRTGFLQPSYSTATDLGTVVKVPYYIAVAPNADFLFHPSYLSNQGVLWQGDWRHRVSLGGITGEYSVKFSGIDQDGSKLPSTLDQASRDKLQGWRGSLQTQGNLSLSSWWRFGWDVTLESDDTFRRFYRLDSILQVDRINTVYLEGISERNYFGVKLYHFGGLLLQDNSATKSQVFPAIDYNYIFDKPVVGGELTVNVNAVNLQRQTGTNAMRASADANWRRKVIDPAGMVWTPFLSARADVTRSSNAFDSDSNTFITDETATRATGTIGGTWSYPFVANTADASHVLAPTAQILVRPAKVSQNRIPDEDSRSLVFDDTLLFDTDKFSGWDRIETGTRANVGLEYTFQSYKGGYARFIAGQSYHLGGDNPYANPGFVPEAFNGSSGVPGAVNPNFSPVSGLNTNRSDYVLGAYLAPISNFRVVAQGRFDEADFSLRRANVYASTNLGPVTLGGQYSYAAATPLLNVQTTQQELLGNINLKLTDRWSVGATGRYDIDADSWLQQGYTLRYGDECFVLTATYSDTNILNPAISSSAHNKTLMLRFELKYLGDFKYNPNVNDTTTVTVNQPPVR